MKKRLLFSIVIALFMVFSVSIYAVDDQEYSLTSYTGAIANGTVAYINNDYAENMCTETEARAM